MSIKNDLLKVSFLSLALLSLPGIAMASDIGTPDIEIIKGLYPGQAYSPYAKRSFPSRVYWGETHLHNRSVP